MAHDASNNNPTKEIVHSLLGILLLLTIISSVAISAWLRPAGNHETATEPATPAGKALAEKLHAIENPAPASSETENASDTAGETVADGADTTSGAETNSTATAETATDTADTEPAETTTEPEAGK
ncbi:MAG: hypothetical protein Q3971_09345 [Moraxella sp.]|nr:hypothetical protein [Moraxella sp.]